MFLASYTDEAACAELEKLTANFGVDDQAVLLGYKAMAEMMRCRYVRSPIEKLLHFSRGKKILESAIQIEPYSTELRYMRYVVQCNAPAMLGYSTNMQVDRKALLDFVSLRRGTEAEEDPLYNMVLNAIKKN